MEKFMNGLINSMSKIVKNDGEKQFEITGDLGTVQIPYSYLTDDTKILSQIIRLLEKGIDRDTIIMFYRNLQTDTQR